jgi:hypothetical protein
LSLRISEISVQLAVDSTQAAPRPPAAAAPTAPPRLTETQMETIVARCVQGVLDRLNRDKDR